MKCTVFRHISIGVAGLGLSLVAVASVTYVAKKGDTLSVIAAREVHGRVWGKKGSVRKVLALNARIKNPDLIFPGQEIELPGERTLTEIKPSAVREPAEVPVTDVTPAPVVLSQPVSSAPAENPGRGFLELDPYFGLTSISVSDKVTGTTATLASTLNLGIDTRLYQSWSEGFRSFIHLKIGVLSFEQPTDPGKSLQGSTNFMPGVGIGGEFTLSESLKLRIFADDQKEVFVRSLSTNTVTVDAIGVPEVGAKFSLNLFEKRDLKLGVAGEFVGLFPVSTSGYSIQSGNLFGGGLYLEQNFLGVPLVSELSYSQRNQNTSLTNQTEKDIILSLHWLIPSGKPREESGGK